MKKDNSIYWIIGIAIVFLVVANLPKQETGMIGLTPHFYKDGVEVFPTRGLFSIVTGPFGTGIYDQISFDISAENIGEIPFMGIQIIDAYPQVFKDALPITTQTLAIGESKILWTSGLMDTEQFKTISPVNFWIEVSGFDTYNEIIIYPDRAESGDITFEPALPSLVVENSITLGGYQEYSSILISSTGIINIDPTIGWLVLNAQTIEISGVINGYAKSNNTGGNGGQGASNSPECGMGYQGGNSGLPMGARHYIRNGAGGGSSGGNFGAEDFSGQGGLSKPVVGTETGKNEIATGMGAGGGGGGGNVDVCGSRDYGGNGGTGQRGGAYVRLFSQNIIISGTIDMRGGNGGSGGSPGNSKYGGAGGAGGTGGIIEIQGDNIDISNGIFKLNGGSGGSGNSGSASGQTGNGGRFKVFYTDSFLNTGTLVTLGNGGTSYINQEN